MIEERVLQSSLQAKLVNNNPDQVLQLTIDLIHKLSGTLPLRSFKTLAPFVNSLIMARISADTRAAATMINALESLCSIVFNAPAYYIPTAVGKTISEEKFGQVGRDAQAAWLIALLFASPQIIMMALTGPLFKLLAQNSSVTEIAANYFQIYAFSIVALSLQSASDQVAQTSGQIYSPAVVNGMGLGVMIFLSIGLGLGKLGMPNLGVKGVAIAAIARALFNFLSYTGYAALLSRYNRDVAKLKLFKLNSRYWDSLKPQILNGIMLTIAFSSLIGAQFLISSIVGRMGPTALSAELVITQWQEFLLIPAVSIGAAVQIAISQALKSKPQNIFRYGNIAVCLSLITPLLYNIITFAKPRWLIEPFLNPEAAENSSIVTILETGRLLLINGMIMFLNTLQMTLGSALMGADKVFIPLALGILSNWLVMGLAWGLADNVQQLNLFVGLGYALTTLVLGTYWTYLWKAESLYTQTPGVPTQIESLTDATEVGGIQADLNPAATYRDPPIETSTDFQETHGSHHNYGELAAKFGVFKSSDDQASGEELVRLNPQPTQKSSGCVLV